MISAANRTSSMSLLSAPTRPRGAGPPRRDFGWGANAPGRRGPPSHLTPPTGPRGGFSPAPSGPESHRGPSTYHRQGSGPPTPHFRSPRTNHLAGLPAIVPGGKPLPSVLDPTIEKRLAQLKADEEKLLEQYMEKQRAKRLGLRDWDRLQQESNLAALRSELAESHLQKMTDGDGLEGAAAF